MATPEAYVGKSVVWYPDTEKNQEPTAAIVTGISFNGALDLQLIPRGSAPSPNAVKRGVRHVDDPVLVTNPQFLKGTGAWDTCEAAETRRKNEIATAERRREEQAKREAEQRKAQAKKPEMAGAGK